MSVVIYIWYIWRKGYKKEGRKGSNEKEEPLRCCGFALVASGCFHPICPVSSDSDQSSGTYLHRWGQPHLSITLLQATARSAEVTSGGESQTLRTLNWKHFWVKWALKRIFLSLSIVLPNKVSDYEVQLYIYFHLEIFPLATLLKTELTVLHLNNRLYFYLLSIYFIYFML